MDNKHKRKLPDLDSPTSKRDTIFDEWDEERLYEERLQRCYEWMVRFHFTHCMDNYLPPKPMTELDEWEWWYHSDIEWQGGMSQEERRRYQEERRRYQAGDSAL